MCSTSPSRRSTMSSSSLANGVRPGLVDLARAACGACRPARRPSCSPRGGAPCASSSAFSAYARRSGWPRRRCRPDPSATSASSFISSSSFFCSSPNLSPRRRASEPSSALRRPVVLLAALLELGLRLRRSCRRATSARTSSMQLVALLGLDRVAVDELVEHVLGHAAAVLVELGVARGRAPCSSRSISSSSRGSLVLVRTAPSGPRAASGVRAISSEMSSRPSRRSRSSQSASAITSSSSSAIIRGIDAGEPPGRDRDRLAGGLARPSSRCSRVDEPVEPLAHRGQRLAHARPGMRILLVAPAPIDASSTHGLRAACAASSSRGARRRRRARTQPAAEVLDELLGELAAGGRASPRGARAG